MPSKRREAIIERLGITPPVATLVRSALDDAITEAESRVDGTGRPVTVLDAGCGRISQLRAFRPRIGRLVGADIHAPGEPLPHLDEFAVVDLCGPRDAFAPGTFDLILSSFTLEHFAAPGAALTNLRSWLAPGGQLVATVVPPVFLDVVRQQRLGLQRVDNFVHLEFIGPNGNVMVEPSLWVCSCQPSLSTTHCPQRIPRTQPK